MRPGPDGHECKACAQYRRRTGRQRPAELAARQADLNYRRWHDSLPDAAGIDQIIKGHKYKDGTRRPKRRPMDRKWRLEAEVKPRPIEPVEPLEPEPTVLEQCPNCKRPNREARARCNDCDWRLTV